MQRIYETDSYSEAAVLHERLMEQGIPSQIIEGSLNKVGIGMPNRYGLWLYFNEHLQDAQKLLAHPDHKALIRMTDKELENFMQQIHSPAGISRVNNHILVAGIVILLVLLMGILLASQVDAAGQNDPQRNDKWIIGTWQLSYDPNGSKKDWIEFHENGDATSIWQNGKRIQGMYIVAPHSVKAVFTENDKDVIMTFFFDATKQQLKIVTSRTGQESIYTKVKE